MPALFEKLIPFRLFALGGLSGSGINAGGLADVTVGGAAANDNITGGQSVSLLVAGSFSGSLTSTSGSVNAAVGADAMITSGYAGQNFTIVALGSIATGTQANAVYAANTLQIAAGGTLAGNFSTGGYAQLGSIGNSDPTVNAGGNIYISSLGVLTPTLTAGGNVQMISFGGMGAATEVLAGNDVTAIWTAGNLEGTFIADHAIGDVTSYADINASFNAGNGGSNPNNDPTFGVLQSIQAWGSIIGSVTASTSIGSITSGATVSATLTAPTIGTVTQNDTGIFSSYPTTPNISTASAKAALQQLAVAIAQAQAGLAAESKAMDAAVAANQAALSQAAQQVIAQNQQAKNVAQAAVAAGNQQVKANIATATQQVQAALAQTKQNIASAVANAQAQDKQLYQQALDQLNRSMMQVDQDTLNLQNGSQQTENNITQNQNVNQQALQTNQAALAKLQANRPNQWNQDANAAFHNLLNPIHEALNWLEVTLAAADAVIPGTIVAAGAVGLLNGGLYTLEGSYFSAGLYAVGAIIPVAGEIAPISRLIEGEGTDLVAGSLKLDRGLADAGIAAALEPYADLGIAEGLVQANSGLIQTTTYYTTTTATATTAGGVAGYVEADYVQQGSAGTPVEEDSETYFLHTDYGNTAIYPIATYTEFQSAANGGSVPETTSYNYTWQTNSAGQVTNQIESETITNPVVSTTQNGSGVANSESIVYDTYGRPVWTMDGGGFITYTAYDAVSGASIQTVDDVNITNLSDLANYEGSYAGGTLSFGANGYNQEGVPELPSGWTTPANGGLNLVSSTSRCYCGRPLETVSPDGSITFYTPDFANHATFTFSGATASLDANGDGTLTAVDTPVTMTRDDIPWSYSLNGVTYEGTYSETLTFSFSGTLQVVNHHPVIPNDFIQGDGASSGFANVFNLIGSGTAANPQFVIQSLSRTLYNAAGQAVETDNYAVIDNATYLATAQGSAQSGALITNQLSGQAPNGNYDATHYAFDVDGRQYQSIDANGTVTDVVYDGLGRVTSTWVGTNDAVSGASGTPGYFDGFNAGTGNNMTEVESYIYDGGSVGDSNLTETIQYPDSAAAHQRVTLYNYDFRDRLVATETGLGGTPGGDVAYPMVTVNSLDNLGDVTATYTFSGDINGAPILMASTGANTGTGVPDQLVGQITAATPGNTSGSPNLIGLSETQYDSMNRPYESLVYSVDPTTGDVSYNAETTQAFYGPRGNVIESVAPTGLVTKDVYNGVGELVMQYQTDGGAVNNLGTPILTYAAASSVVNDVVVEQTAYGYDGDGNLIETVDAQRFNTDPIDTTGEGALFTDTANSDGSLNVTPASQADVNLGARIYYSASYYDAADRQIASVNAGTNPNGTNGAATPWTRPAMAPTSVTDSNFAGDLITLTSYNPAGYVYETTDPRGIVSANFYDNLGRATKTTQAYDTNINNGNPTSDANQTTLYTYDGIGDQTSMTAEDVDSNTGVLTGQTTQYIYGVSQTTGSQITSNDLLYQTIYPNVGQSPSTVSNSYNALGQVIQSTDRDGNVHAYTYDSLGRVISDTVTTLGANVDGSVLRIDTAYNNQGLPYLLTSYADTTGTTIVNQVENIYNGLGQLTQQYQAVNGAVDPASTPSVQYTYSDPSNGSRVLSMTYPNGRVIDYNYYSNTNIDGPLDNAIGRLNSISDGANSGDSGTVLEQYEYLGLATIIARNHPQTGINLTLVGSGGSIGAGGDQYVGLDQFGRVVNQNWISVQSVDNYTYTYDADGNVTAKNNVLNSTYSEAYTYDSLNRLTNTTRNSSAYQSWNLDSQGNWSSYTNQGSTQTETANSQNQITSISGGTTPVYDANGNMTTDQNGNTLVYDAWNRLVSVSNSSSQVIAKYTYDARNYAVTVTYPQGNNEIPAGTTNYIYYNNSWQVIEVRTDGTASANVTRQMVWSASYVNATVLQDTYSNGTLLANERLYFLQDADWNTTAVVGYNPTTQTWGVVQRYIYDGYGNITILNADWSATPSGTQAMVNALYQGMQYDPITSLYYGRARWYSTSLGRWVSQDSSRYVNGASLYQMELGDPVCSADPTGLAPMGAAATSKDVGGGDVIVGSIPFVGEACEGTECVMKAMATEAPGMLNQWLVWREEEDSNAGVNLNSDPIYTALEGWRNGALLTCTQRNIANWWLWYFNSNGRDTTPTIPAPNGKPGGPAPRRQPPS